MTKDGNPTLDPKNGDRPLLARPFKDREEKDKPIRSSLSMALVEASSTGRVERSLSVSRNQKIDTLMAIILEHIRLTQKLVGRPGEEAEGIAAAGHRRRTAQIGEAAQGVGRSPRPLYVNSAVESELITSATAGGTGTA